MTVECLSPSQKKSSVPDLIPARTLNEFVYCPRLCYLQWIEQEWDDNVYTLEGTFQHRRVDEASGNLHTEGESDSEGREPLQVRSLTLSAPGYGLIARLDLAEQEDGKVTPVDYKRGKVPENEERSYEPERVQLCAQALVLRENGYRCDEGVIYYAGSNRRVTVPITDELIERTLQYVKDIRYMGECDTLPPPLIDSPKCPNCSLVGVCLPDETLFSVERPNQPVPVDNVRRLTPARDDAVPLYVQEYRAYVRKSGENLDVTVENKKIASAKLMELSQVCLLGNVQISTQTVHELLNRHIPILYFSYGGWFIGMSNGLPHKNVELRRCQYRQADSTERCLQLARRLIEDKIANCRTLLRRNGKDDNPQAIHELQHAERQAQSAPSLDVLLGIEGNAARVYFQHFSAMLKKNDDAHENVDLTFDFENRNRRPPKDPVNALLSYAYSLLTKDLTITLNGIGFDPYLGFYHQPRYGRPALALDMMEPFRPLIADSVVITCINNGITGVDDFVRAGNAVALKDEARKRFLAAYERRMDSLITHPLFNYRISYRRVLEVQCRLLGRYLMGELSHSSQGFVNAYFHDGGAAKLGYSFDNGGSIYVHAWPADDQVHNVLIQDYKNNDPTTRYGDDGENVNFNPHINYRYEI